MVFSSSPPTPLRTLNPHKFAESRAPELESLHSIVAARLNHDFRIHRGKRRRTTGHKNHRRKLPDGAESTENGPPSRRVRRRLELRKNPASGFCASGDGTRRLRTHLWHAKRFTMVKRWGFYLPLGIQGRGRGSRAVLKWLKNGALVHDASYCYPIQLEGSEESISSVLKMVLQTSPSGASDELSAAVRKGVRYENATLHHAGTPLSNFIAPVIIMWRPALRNENHVNTEQEHLPSGCSISNRNECSTSLRQLWIWIHAASFEEGFDALRFACQKEMHERGVTISCFSLEGRIAELEVIGSKAIQVLKKILHPVSESCSIVEHSIDGTSSQFQKSISLNHADQLQSHSIVSLIVHDPRVSHPEGTQLVSKPPSTEFQDEMHNEDVQELNAIVSGVPTENEVNPVSLWSKPEAFLSDSKSLWECNDKLYPPVPDNILCTEKHDSRLKYFNLDRTDDGALTTEAKDGFSRSCSVLLLKHANLGNSSTRWSIILPLSWVKAFWIPLISYGAHAIGLRERRWVACNNGLPYFPYDFPDCRAYSLFMAAEATASDSAAELRPPAVRPLRVPIPSPWHCIMSTVEKGANVLRDHRTLSACTSLVNPDPTFCGSTSSSQQGGEFFGGFIIRTSNILSQYSEKFHSTQLLIFSKMSTTEKGFSELINSNRLSWATESADTMAADRKLSFIRVLLHAYKEGAFEEGAVVCAPNLADISRWSSRSEDYTELQIPQSLVGSYFTQQEDSGKWELQVPEDVSNKQSYRWPIGFITTGFVRGSSKPVAVSLCEARLLSLLRWQQWRETKKARSEIFVHVRNLRSTAYRRAMVTVVMEQEKEDLLFM